LNNPEIEEQENQTSKQTNSFATDTVPESAVEAPTAFVPPKYVRTPFGVFEPAYSAAWGGYLRQLQTDPDVKRLNQQAVFRFKVKKNFPLVPADLITMWVRLCSHMVNNGTKGGSAEANEVSCLLLRSKPHFDKWKIVIPRQVVSKGSVHADTQNSIDIETGEEYHCFPPTGWAHAGSFHSHNDFAAFHSATDNANEIGVPGLHVTFGMFKHEDDENNQSVYFETASSIVQARNRYLIDFEEVSEVIHGKELTKATYNSAVLKFISFPKSPPTIPGVQYEEDSYRGWKSPQPRIKFLEVPEEMMEEFSALSGDGRGSSIKQHIREDINEALEQTNIVVGNYFYESDSWEEEDLADIIANTADMCLADHEQHLGITYAALRYYLLVNLGAEDGLKKLDERIDDLTIDPNDIVM